jgi:GMP synthase (glutamine-hydrolysing)
MANKIIVIDFGSQYNQLIVRRIREFGVYSGLVSHKLDIDKIKQDKDIKGIIFSGGPNSVYAKHAPKINKRIYELKLPILGICYGMQLLALMFGGKVSNSHKKEYGRNFVKIETKSPLTIKLKSHQQV